MDINTDPLVNRSRGKGAVIVCAVISVILAAAAFAGVWHFASAEAEKNPVRLAQETVIPNISENMVRAIDPSVIENYRAAHDMDTNYSRYLFDPEDGFDLSLYMDTDLTEECVSAVTSLSIDRKQNADLTALSYFKNLSVLRISHAEFLTDADIAEMNRLNLSEVEFIMDRNEISNTQKFADFSACTAPNKHITLNNADFINENTAYAIYHMFGRYYPSVICTGLDYDLYKKLDDKLQTLIDKVDFTNCRNDRERLLKCTVVVMKHLYYDDVVSDFSMYNTEVTEESSIYDLVVYYNDCQLSSNLLTDGIGYGCCTNFSSLLLAVCVKMDYEAYIINGKRSASSGFFHDWVYARADGAYYNIDMTEINRWFKRMAGMFYGYKGAYIDGDGDILDDPDFLARFSEQVFETYQQKITSTYVFFDEPAEQFPQIDPEITAVVYNVTDTPVVKYIPDYAPGRKAALIKSAAAGAAVLLTGAAVTLIVGKKRRGMNAASQKIEIKTDLPKKG